MKTITFLSAIVLAATVHLLAAVHPPEQFLTGAGPLSITPIMHASLMIEAGGQVIHVDPAMGNYDGLPKADIILITDIHGDHMVPEMIEKLTKPNTTIFAPAAVAKTVTKATVLNNGDTTTSGRFTIEAVPMYNMKPDPANGQTYHEKGRGNGYILTYGGLRIYIAGDTEGTPEMRALKQIDVAFIPMNLPYTMTPQAAADAIRAFRPRYVYPYHYQGQDPAIAAKALENLCPAAGPGTCVDVRLRDWYAK
jgi:L-ascorbate metabolism protein UlaG (beta-lactamase superfamily)